MQKTNPVPPGLWALWKVEAKITRPLSRSKLLAAPGREHRALYSGPCGTIVPRLLRAGPCPRGCTSCFCPILQAARAHAVKAKPPNGSWKTLRCPGDKNKNHHQTSPNICTGDQSVGTWRRSICWGR